MPTDAGEGRGRASLKQIINNEWFPPGLLFIGFGLLGLYVSRGYELGDVNHMGPGYFPRVLCYGLLILGTLICWRGLFERKAAETDGNVARGFVMILLAMVVFGLTIERLGFVISLALVVIVASFGRRDQKPLEVAMMTAIIVVLSVVVFIWALKLPFRLWPNL